MTEIRIYTSQGDLLLQTPVNKGSVRKKELMKEDYISVKINLAEPVFFPLGCHCAGEDIWRFETTSLQNLPTYNKSIGGYEYTIILDAYYFKWKNKIFKFTPQFGGAEAAWSLTAKLSTFLDLFVDNLKELGYKYGDSQVAFSYSIDTATVKTEEAKLLSFDSTTMIDALNQLAEAWECEWWVRENVICFGKCEEGRAEDIIDFEIGVNCETIVPSASRTTYGTRLYALGSTRNIPPRYRKDLIFSVFSVNGPEISDTARPLKLEYFRESAVKGDIANASIYFRTGVNEGISAAAIFSASTKRLTLLNGLRAEKGDTYEITNIIESKVPVSYFTSRYSGTVLNAIYEHRLMLPEPLRYIDSAEGLAPEEYVEIVKVFDEVFPRTDCKIASLNTKTYTDKETDEDGNEYTVEWDAYRFTTSDLKFSKDYILEGETLKMQFQTGSLTGKIFEVQFFDVGETTDANGNKNTAQVWEIVANEDYGLRLPDTILTPKVGDKFILTGWDAGALTDLGLIDNAEKELKEKAVKYVSQLEVDPNTYTSHLFSDYAYGLDKDGNLNHDLAKDFDIGQRVCIKNKAYFKSGERLSRIIGFEKCLDLPYDTPQYIVGESTVYSRLKDIEDSIQSLTLSGNNLVGNLGNGSGVYLIKRNDNTPPSDYNAFSAARSDQRFLRKDVRDRAREPIIFAKGAELGDYANGVSGGMIDKQGNAELQSLIVRQFLSSPKFTSGLTGEGWKLWMQDTLSNLEIDNLTVRRVMNVFELLIEKVRSVGGQICVSAANGKVKTVEERDDSWHITFEGDSYFAAHDLMRCATFRADGTDKHGYWVEIASTEGGGVIIPKSEFGGEEPREGDECVLMGNTETPNRQNLILISATEDRQPRIDVLDSVSTKSFANCLRARLGCLDGITDVWFPSDNQPHGYGLYADNAYLRGTFLLTTGEDILTKFEIAEGKLESAIEGLRQDVSGENYIQNSSFANGLSKWDTENDTVFYLFGDKWIWANDHILSRKGDGASFVRDNGRNVVRILNKFIQQKNANMNIPTFKPNENGKKEAVPVYLSFFYRCTSAGKLTVKFENVNKSGFEDFDSLQVVEELVATNGYMQYTCDGFWNGTGDFTLSFTGEIYLYMLVLSTDKVTSLSYKYKTLFEQSERLVKISAAVFDKNDEFLQETGLMVKPEGSGLYAVDADGHAGFIGVTIEDTDGDGNRRSVVKLTADNILLEGVVTANKTFKVHTNGSIEATGGKIGGFEISHNHIGTDKDAVPAEESTISIYNTLFRIGDKLGHVELSNELVPGILGGAYSSVMNVTNHHSYASGDLYASSWNYGIRIDVSGGTKNFGIHSNAAIMASSLISMGAQWIDLTKEFAMNKLDFAQKNIIILDYHGSEYDIINVTLPNERQVKDMFGISDEYPVGFASVATFHCRATIGKQINIKDVYDANGNRSTVSMENGDTLTLLILGMETKEKIIYQVINYQN